jgi:hypothetical protein
MADLLRALAAFLKWLWSLIWTSGPRPATGMKFSSKGAAMGQATVTVGWTPPSASGIKSQVLTLTVNGTAQPPVSLAAGVASYNFLADQNAVIHGSLVESDGVLNSTALEGDYTVPEVTPPPPATNMTFTSVPVA